MNTKEKGPSHVQSTPAASCRFPSLHPSSTDSSPQTPRVAHLGCPRAHLWIVSDSTGVADTLAAGCISLSGLPSFATVLLGIVPPEEGLGLRTPREKHGSYLYWGKEMVQSSLTE